MAHLEYVQYVRTYTYQQMLMVELFHFSVFSGDDVDTCRHASDKHEQAPAGQEIPVCLVHSQSTSNDLYLTCLHTSKKPPI